MGLVFWATVNLIFGDISSVSDSLRNRLQPIAGLTNGALVECCGQSPAFYSSHQAFPVQDLY
jgi:hypothetical protein